jgi:hypothetical protein
LNGQNWKEPFFPPKTSGTDNKVDVSVELFFQLTTTFFARQLFPADEFQVSEIVQNGKK